MIDAHQHFLDPTRFEYPWIGPGMEVLNTPALPEDLAPVMRQCGVTRTIAVQARQTLEETRWLLQLAEENAWIAGVVGWVDLIDPKLDAVLDEFAGQPKLVGVRHVTHDEPEVDWIVREDVLRGLSVIEKRGLAFDLLIRPQHLHHVPTLCKRLPNLRMVIDHIAKPAIHSGEMAGWREAIAAAAECEGLCCKLSGMITEADPQQWRPDDLKPYVDQVVQCFGYSRLMFGSDWPVCRLAGSYGQVFDALVQALGPISEVDRARVFGGTAAGFYRLEV